MSLCRKKEAWHNYGEIGDIKAIY